MTPDLLSIIGRNTLIAIGGVSKIPAKVDTGAFTSAIWASDIIEKKGVLHFKLFAPGSPYYTGERFEIATGKYTKRLITSSSGVAQERYVVNLAIMLEGRRYNAQFSLADRSNMAYPILLGRQFLRDKFLVDINKMIDPLITKQLQSERQARQIHTQGIQ